MRVVKKEDIEVLEQIELMKHPNYKKMDAYRYVKRCMPCLHVIAVAVATFLALLMPQNYIEWLVDIQLVLVIRVIVSVFKFTALIVSLLTVMIPLHEVLHALPLGISKCYMVFNFPQSIGVYCCQWHSKYRVMLSMILPFVIYTIFAVIMFWVSGAWYPCLWFMLINTLCASTDIFMFIYVMINVPRRALICEYYYYIPESASNET